MYQLRIFFIVISLVTGIPSIAQSSVDTLTPEHLPGTQLEKIEATGLTVYSKKDSISVSLENTISKYSLKADSVVNRIKNIPLKKLDNTQNTVTKYNQKTDSIVNTIQEIPTKYFKKVDKKINTYSDRITARTEKTLVKLSRWESRIKKLLDKASPETSAKLFGKNQVTFASLLLKVKEGKNIVSNSSKKYDEYRDKLSISIKYIESQKGKLDSGFIKPVTSTSNKIKALDQDIANSEAVEKIIKERKKQLLEQSIKYIGKSKYFSKINKESYYYVETLKNYKEIFSNPKKAEQTAKTILDNIPAFKKFYSQNSMLASLFGSGAGDENVASLDGLQTRSSVNGSIENRIAGGGPNVKNIISQNMQAAQSQLNILKLKLSKSGGGSGNDQVPDFKPNEQKSKTFLQRIEYGFNYQFEKSTNLLPTTADIGLSAGYKLNNKSIIGIGFSYKIGMGTIQKIKFSNEGIGLRSYLDWQLKKQLYITGGFEMNHNSSFKNIHLLNKYDEWQQSGLIGLSKKIIFKAKGSKGTKVQMLYDMLYNRHYPVSQPFVFRIGQIF